MAATARHADQLTRYARTGRDEDWHGERPWPALPLPRGARSEDASFHHGKRTVSMRLLRRESLLVASGLLILLIVALALTSVVADSLGGPAALMALLFLLVFLGFATLPAWTAALVDDIDTHRAEFAEPNDADET